MANHDDEDTSTSDDQITQLLGTISKAGLNKVLNIAETRFDSLRRDRANIDGIILDPEDDDYNDLLHKDISQAMLEGFSFVEFATDLLKMHKKVRPDQYTKTDGPKMTDHGDGVVSFEIPLGKG